MLLWFTVLQTVLLLFINLKGFYICVFITMIESSWCFPSVTVQAWVCTKVYSLMYHFFMILLFQMKELWQVSVLVTFIQKRKCCFILRCLLGFVYYLMQFCIIITFFLCYAPCHIRAIFSWSFGLNQKNIYRAGIIFWVLIFLSEITLKA